MNDNKTLSGLNHITIAVSDLERSLDFYVGAMGFQLRAKWKSGAYLSLGTLWFVLSCDRVCRHNDYTHIAFSINADDFEAFKAHLLELKVRQWKENSSEGDSMYILDPDNHKLEIHVGDLQSRLKSLQDKPYDGLQLY